MTTTDKLQHIAIIMDGNRRWAKEQNVPTNDGHKAGVEALLNLLDTAIAQKISYLTLYTFSTENWQRDDNEVKAIIHLLITTIDTFAQSLSKKGIAIKFIGNRQSLDDNIIKKIQQVESISVANKKLQLNIAFNYGGRCEIIDATKQIIHHIQTNKITIDEIDEQLFEQNLYTANIPHPDLLIRTGGKQRISNFLLWQLSYTELYFTETLWPDFSSQDLQKALQGFHSRSRSFGGN